MNSGLDWAAQLRSNRRFRSLVTLGVVVLGPVLAFVTFLVFGNVTEVNDTRALRVVGLLDLVYVLAVAALVARQIAKIVSARRAHSAGSRLHMRLTAVFAVIALIPTILVAVFATATLNFGLEGWFSDRVRTVLGNSLEAARAYESEHKETLEADARLLANFLEAQKRRLPLLSTGDLRELLNRGQLQMQRALPEAYVINGAAELVARGERSYLFDYEAPTGEQLERARGGEVVLIEDWTNYEFRALVMLQGFLDRYLYVTRDVDGGILSLLDDTQATVLLYQQLENERGRLLFEFALIYLAFALILILAAVWLGMWFAERLANPVGRLAGAAARVGQGDLEARVPEVQGDDEIAVLSRAFNHMTRQVKGQRDALILANQETEARRRLFDSVLSGVTAGVVGLGRDGKIELMNAAAQRMLDLQPETAIGAPLAELVPEFSELLEKLSGPHADISQGEVMILRPGVHENLLVRIATRHTEGGDIEGFVVAFDDVTDLVTAQRMAAWGDVARRIAHEIKNPLTPIQLSAERLRRKFAPRVTEERELLEQYADVIVRQTQDLRRIVDEFSKFARMPAAERRQFDLIKILRESVLLQDAGEIAEVRLEAPDEPVFVFADPTLIGQAVTNLVKNATEAIEARTDRDAPGQIRVLVETTDTTVTVRIQDNGIGLPSQRARLFEPYVTNRDKGTGLGLSIVKKIIEDHEGQLELVDAPVFDGATHAGAEARFVLGRVKMTEQKTENAGQMPAQKNG